MRQVLICMTLLAYACSVQSRPPAAEPSSLCTECEQLLKATILDSIERENRAKQATVQSRAGEKIAQAQAEEANKQAVENEAWRRWGPAGMVGAFLLGGACAASVLLGMKR